MAEIKPFEELQGRICRLKIGDVQCDGSIREVHALKAEKTSHAVEDGSEISDHYRVKDSDLVIDAIVSNSPLSKAFPGQAWISSVENLKKKSEPGMAAWLELTRYMREKKRISVKTGFVPYDDMVIMSVTYPRTGKRGLHFTITLSEYRTSFTMSVDAIKKPKNDTVRKKKKGGQKNLKKVEEKQGESILHSMKEKAKSMVKGFF